MKIGRLKLHNFGIFEDCEIVMDEPFSLYRGLNAMGKSTIAQAAQLALTAQCEGVDGKGVGAKDAIRLGADKAVITAGLETAKGPMELVVTYRDSGRTPIIHAGSGKDEGGSMARGFEKYLEINREPLSCVLDSRYFISEKPPDQRAILASLMLPKSYEFDAKMVELTEKHLGRQDWTRNPVLLIDTIYGDTKSGVYNARTKAKAELGAVHIPQKPSKPEFTAEEVQSKLTSLREKQNKEAKKVKSGGTVQVGRIEQNITQEKEKLVTAQQDRKNAMDRQVSINADLLDGPALTSLKQQAAKRAQYEELATQINALDAEIASQQQAQEIFKEMLVDEQGDPVDHAECPTCTQTITKEFITGKVREHEASEKQADADKGNLLRQQSELGDIAGAEAKIKANEAKLAELLEVKRQITAAQERIQFAETAVKDLEAALAEAKAKEASPVDTTALDSMTEEIGQWEGRLAPAVQYESTLAQIERAEKQWEDSKAKVNDLETLCSYWGDKGVKAKLIKEHIGGFQDSVNGVLSKWGYLARLSIEPYCFEVMTPRTSPNYLNIRRLSGFEKLAFAVALQAAIAVATKIRMIIVDAADVMIGTQRNKLFGCVKAMLDSKALDQAILFLPIRRKKCSKKDGVAVYFVENGRGGEAVMSDLHYDQNGVPIYKGDLIRSCHSWDQGRKQPSLPRPCWVGTGSRMHGIGSALTC